MDDWPNPPYRASLARQLKSVAIHAALKRQLVMAHIVMGYVVMAHVVMAYIVMAYIVMAYIVMACMFMSKAAAIDALKGPLCDPTISTCLQDSGLSDHGSLSWDCCHGVAVVTCHVVVVTSPQQNGKAFLPDNSHGLGERNKSVLAQNA